ncbi:tetratricopeptide repeat protein [Streptomyces goshikiensis]|uniref:tetratricopeptide repeat protein n=1 Tax=Streptomyces goshikiensis TaxID=1942 RepID=UPI00365717A9
MTALVDLLQHGPRPVDAAPGTPPERTLLKHEDRFWEASAKAPAHKLDLDAATLGAAVAVAALCGAGTRDEAVQVITTLPSLPGHQTAAAANWLATLYPADGNRYWGSLQPDRVAEYHASRVIEGGAIPLAALLAAGSPTQQAQTMTVLARAAIAHYNAGRTTNSDRVLHTLDTALDTTPLAYQAIQSTTAALPYPSRVTAPLALKLTTTLTQANRQLADLEPAAFERDLAASLSNLGGRLSEAGRRAEALTAEQQAVEIYRRLADLDPTAFEPDLATSLSNLGNHLSEAGRRAEALTAEQQAVEIYRRLAVGDPAAFEPDLAGSLSNLGNHLSEAWRRAEALTTTEQAVEIRRRLAVGDPAAFEPDLARSLTVLAMLIAMKGDLSGALRVTAEAVELYRRRIATTPTLLPGLHGALVLQASVLDALGRPEDAEAVRRWLGENPLPPGSRN